MLLSPVLPPPNPSLSAPPSSQHRLVPLAAYSCLTSLLSSLLSTASCCPAWSPQAAPSCRARSSSPARSRLLPVSTHATLSTTATYRSVSLVMLTTNLTLFFRSTSAPAPVLLNTRYKVSQSGKFRYAHI